MQKCVIILFVSIFLPLVLPAQTLPALIPYRDGNKWGYADSNGKIIVAPVWRTASLLYKNKAIVSGDNKEVPGFPFSDYLMALLNEKGNYIIPPDRQWTGNGPYLLNARNEKGKWGVIDSNNNVLVPFEYDILPLNCNTSFLREMFVYYGNSRKNKYILVSQNGKIGLIGLEDHISIPCEYDNILDTFQYDRYQDTGHHNLYFVVEKNKKFGLIDVHNKTIVPIRYSQNNFRHGEFCGHKGFYVDSALFENKNISGIDCYYIGLNQVYLQQPHKEGFIDEKTGEFIFPMKYSSFSDFLSKSFFIVCDIDTNGRTHCGIVDKNLKVIIPVKYDLLGFFYEKDSSMKIFLINAIPGQDEVEREKEFLHIRYINPKTFRPKGCWKKKRVNQIWHFIHEPANLYQNHPSNNASYDHNCVDEGYCMLRKGKSESSFYEDSVQYDVIKQMPKGQQKQYCVWYNGHAKRGYAIIDTSLNLLYGPDFTIKDIIKFKPADSIVVCKNKDNKFVAKDMNQKPLSTFIPDYLVDIIKDHDNLYLLSRNKIIDSTREFSNRYQDQVKFNMIYDYKILNKEGKEISILRKYKALYFVDNIGKKTDSYIGYLMVNDSNNKTGMIAINGKIIYPKISFKYSIDSVWQGIGDNLFKISNKKSPISGIKLVNSSNSEIIKPPIPVFSIDSASINVPGQEKLKVPGLYHVEGNHTDFYIDRHQRIY